MGAAWAEPSVAVTIGQPTLRGAGPGGSDASAELWRGGLRLAEAELGTSGGERGSLPPVGSSLIYQGLGEIAPAPATTLVFRP